MEHLYDVPDSTDWLPTKLPTFAPVESAMRCQVCKDFFDTPMMTSCCHTFCSICIRRCLTSDGKCPTCRAEEQELRLRRNWTVQELVDAFRVARPGLLHLAQRVAVEDANMGMKALKRKLSGTDLEGGTDSERGGIRRATRSRRRRSPVSPHQPITVIDDDEYDVDYTPGLNNRSCPVTTAHSPSIEDGLAACPICEQRMKEEEVFPHLDVCDGGRAHKSATSFGRLKRKYETLSPRLINRS